MPIPQLLDEHGSLLTLVPADAGQIRGHRLPGALAMKTKTRELDLFYFHWEQGQYQIALLLANAAKGGILQLREFLPGFRFEAVLKGEVQVIHSSGAMTKLKEGQYHFTKDTPYRLKIPRHGHCDYLVAYYTPGIMIHLGIDDEMQTTAPRYMTEELNGIIRDAFRNPYQGKLQELYYRKLVSDILFLHLASAEQTSVPGLSSSDLAAVRHADAILSADLSMHYKIPELCALTGTNEYKLKRGFRLLYNMGMFARLLNKRMNHAKLLLTTTDKPVKEIAYEAGYETHAGFITSFRKRFGKTPLDWRNDTR